MTDLPLFQCWHHYVPDLDGLDFCTKCGDCPGERLAEQQAELEDNGGPDFCG